MSQESCSSGRALDERALRAAPRLESRATDRPELPQWQPIETAPVQPFQSGEWFMPHSPALLLWTGGYCVIGSYGFTQKAKGRWKSSWGGVIEPTHWMPLPDPPASSADTPL